jgi:hypothetical protein
MLIIPTQSPLPGLEPEAAIDIHSRRYRAQIQKQEYRQIIASALAQKILGHSARLEHNESGLFVHEENPEEDAGPGEALKTRFAALMMLGAEPDNHVAGQFDGNEGDTFAGSSTLWKSSLRLDPSWMETMRKRTRKTARERFQAMRDQMKRNSLADWYAYIKKDRKNRYLDIFMTLTMPHRAESNTLEEVKRFNLAWRRLTKGDWWVSEAPVFGGVKAIEDALTADGPHVHGHFALISKHIDQDKLHTEWTKALRWATRKLHGEELTSDPLIPDLRAIVKRHPKDGLAFISMDDALDEICKYLTKPSDLLFPHINRAGRTVHPPSGDVLLGLCLVQRWPRMFELFRAARAVQGSPKAVPPSLDTSCISVSPPPVPLPEFWEEGGIEPEERADFRLKCSSASVLGFAIKKEKPPSWRELMQTTTLSEWLQIIHARVLSGRRFRINWLRSYNPSLDVMTLSGTRIVSNVWPEECML